MAKGIDLRNAFLAVWVPFIAADLGNFFGGGASGWLIKRGWSLGAARRAVVVFGGIGVLLLIPTISTTNIYVITTLFALATFSYAAFSTIANVLPSDLFESGSVASVSGVSGTAAGIGTIIAFNLIGHYSDLRQATATHRFRPDHSGGRADSVPWNDSRAVAGEEHKRDTTGSGTRNLICQTVF